MAAVQRKLVHKQFNSPMGLYSQQNVKETLDRELKAFGSDGIEIDEQIAKPLNLANSAVLRAVEEEEEMKCEPTTTTCERPSRPRHRFYHQSHTPVHQQQLEQIKTQYLCHQHDITIDRDTVLKINRLATRRNLHKRDHSWPPPDVPELLQCVEVGSTPHTHSQSHSHSQTPTHLRSSSNDNVVHFDESVCRRHGIDALREKFNSPTRIIEPTAEQLRQRNKTTPQWPKKASNKSANANVLQNGPMTNETLCSRPAAAAESDFRQLTAVVDIKREFDTELESNTPKARGFSAPETKAADVDVGLVEPRRQYYEQLAHGFKKWHSTDNVTSESKHSDDAPLYATHLTSAAGYNPRQSHSLERGRSKRRQLPPLKPRTSSGGSPSTTRNISLISGAAGGHLSKSPKLQRRSIKLATEIKICYDTDDANDVKEALRDGAVVIVEADDAAGDEQTKATGQQETANEWHSGHMAAGQYLNKSTAVGGTDLEHIPLPPTPAAVASSQVTAGIMAGNDKSPTHDTRIIPIEVENGEQQTKIEREAQQHLRQLQFQQQQQQHLRRPQQPTAEQQQQKVRAAQVTQYKEQQKKLQQKLEAEHEKRIKQQQQKSPSNNTRPRLTQSQSPQRPPKRDLSTVSAQQIYDDACIYLRSIDLEDRTVAYIPAAITIVPSPTKEMMERWSEPQPLQANIAQTRADIPTPPPPPPPPPPPVNERTSSRTNASISLPKASHDDDANTKSEIMARSNQQQKTADKLEQQRTYVTRLPATPNGIQLTRQSNVERRKMPATAATTPKGHINNTTSGVAARSRSDDKLRRRGIYYTDGEYVYGPFDDTNTADIKPLPDCTGNATEIGKEIAEANEKRQVNAAEIAALEAKYGQIQQSIAQHLKQIDRYMENAKMALNRSVLMHQHKQQKLIENHKTLQLQVQNFREQTEEPQIPLEVLTTTCTIASPKDQSWVDNVANLLDAPVFVLETPLQMLRRQMHQDKMLLPALEKSPLTQQQDSQSTQRCLVEVPTPVENMPVVEQALQDLSAIEATHSQGNDVGDYGELLILERRIVPTANKPKRVTILEEFGTDAAPEITEIIDNVVASKLAPQQTETDNGVDDVGDKDENANAAIAAVQSAAGFQLTQPVDNDGDDDAKDECVDSNFEQLLAESNQKAKATKIPLSNECADAQKPQVIKMPKLNIAAARQYGAQRASRASEQQQQLLPAKPKPKELSKTVVSGYVATQKSQEDLLEQVIDVLDAQSNQQFLETATKTTSRVPTIEQKEQQSPGADQKVPTTPPPLQPQTEQKLAVEQQKCTSQQPNQQQQQQQRQPIAAKPQQSAQNQEQSATYTSANNDNKNNTATAKHAEITPKPQKNTISAMATARRQDQPTPQQSNVGNARSTVAAAAAAAAAMAALKVGQQVLETATTNTQATVNKIVGRDMPTQTQHVDTVNTAAARVELTSNGRDNNNAHKVSDNFDTYQATYEIPSPAYITRQISWDDTLEQRKQKAEVQITHELPATVAVPAKFSTLTEPLTQSTRTAADTSKSPLHCIREQRRSMTPNPPIRKYPAALIAPNVPPRAASPFGLNPLDIADLVHDTAPSPPHASSKRSDIVTPHLCAYVPQVEGHNVGLLVRAAVSPTRALGPLTHADVTDYADDIDADAGPDVQLQRGHATDNIPRTTTPTTTSALSSTPSTATVSDAGNSALRACHRQSATAAATVTITATATSAQKMRNPSQLPPPFQYLLSHYDQSTATASAAAASVPATRQPISDSDTELTQAHTEQRFNATEEQEDDEATAAETAHSLTLHECNSAAINRSFDNVSPRPYITAMEGYKRVAWPPVSEERIVREFTPQPQSQTPVGAPYQQATQHQQQQHQQPQHHQQHHPQQQHQQQQPHQHQQGSAAPPAQDPQGPLTVYNNVHGAPRQSSPYPHQNQPHQQQHQPHPHQHHQPQQQQQQQPPHHQQYPHNQHQHQHPHPQQHQHHPHHHEPQQQQQYQPPQQYPQAQFNGGSSHDHDVPPYQPQQNVYQTIPEPTSPSGWKHIQPPQSKPYHQYQAPVGSNAEPHYPNYQQQSQQPQQQQQQYQQQPQYRAASYDQYQPPQHHQPQQQAPPQYNNQPQPQYPYQQQQQQYPSWAHNQQPPAQSFQQPQQQQYQQPPQQQQQPPQQQYQAPPSSNYQTQPHYQQPQQQQQQYHQPQYQSVPQTNQYNSYSQPQQQYQPQQQQQQPYSQDLPDHQHPPHAQSLPQDYRGGSPGIITLRKEAPVSQKPAPVYTSQPAAVSYQGGSNMRGDLKWPPPEYKEAAQKENEERRKLALGPVCRPRKVHRDYTTFFAKNALNSCYPSYKVPPGTQHMLA